MELDNNTVLKPALKEETSVAPLVASPVASSGVTPVISPTAKATAAPEPAERPLPDGLRYFMVGLLVVGLVGVLSFGYIRQSAVKPPATTGTTDCKDPVTENRLRETLKQSPNDFATLMDWGYYNLSCDKNYPAAVAAYHQASELSDQPNSTVSSDERTEAHFRLGLAYFYNQSLTEARSQFELLIAQNPQDASALFALGSSYRDNPEKASVYLKQVEQVAPGSEMAQLAQTMLADFSKTTPAPTAAPPPTAKK